MCEKAINPSGPSNNQSGVLEQSKIAFREAARQCLTETAAAAHPDLKVNSKPDYHTVPDFMGPLPLANSTSPIANKSLPLSDNSSGLRDYTFATNPSGPAVPDFLKPSPRSIKSN